MNQTTSFSILNGYKDINGAKEPPLRSLDTMDSPPAPFEDDHYFHGDVIHSPRTPPLTIGSSRSAASSIVPCDVFGCSAQQCSCQSQTDPESIQFQGSDKG